MFPALQGQKNEFKKMKKNDKNVDFKKCHFMIHFKIKNLIQKYHFVLFLMLKTMVMFILNYKIKQKFKFKALEKK